MLKLTGKCELGENTDEMVLCAALEWPQSRVIARSHKEPRIGETGKLCIESCSGVSTLVAVPIATLTGQGDGKPNY